MTLWVKVTPEGCGFSYCIPFDALDDRSKGWVLRNAKREPTNPQNIAFTSENKDE